MLLLGLCPPTDLCSTECNNVFWLKAFLLKWVRIMDDQGWIQVPDFRHY